MPRGFGRGMWAFGPYGLGGYPLWGGGGRGNPFPFCRFFPWLPRWWWATPYAAYYAATTPYTGFSYPFYGMGYIPPYGYPGYGVGYPAYGMGFSGYGTGYPGSAVSPARTP